MPTVSTTAAWSVTPRYLEEAERSLPMSERLLAASHRLDTQSTETTGMSSTLRPEQQPVLTNFHEFLLERPLLEAIRSDKPVVLLIDEVDRVEMETEALLLEVLDAFQVTIPELGTITANYRPLVVLTSNNTRELSEALKRRCLFLHIDYPSVERERRILLHQAPDLPEALAEKIARTVYSIRQMAVRKAPSVSESLDWARTLLALGIEDVDAEVAAETLGVLLKYQSDIDRVSRELLEQ